MRKFTMLLTAAAAVLLPASGQAATLTPALVDFTTDVGGNFTGTYAQNGYDVIYASGGLRILNNNPTFGDAIAGNNAVGGSFNLARSNNGRFSLNSFLGGSGLPSTTATYTLTGYLAGIVTYNQTLTGTTGTGNIGTVSNRTFTLMPTPIANVFDRVTFAISSTASSPLVDNINLTSIDPDPVVLPPTGAVPEPAQWAMLIGGFGLVGATARRRIGVPTVTA